MAKKVTDKTVGRIFLNTVRKADNWSPTTCPIDELRQHLADLESIEDMLELLANRAVYLRGVLAARTVSAMMTD